MYKERDHVIFTMMDKTSFVLILKCFSFCKNCFTLVFFKADSITDEWVCVIVWLLTAAWASVFWTRLTQRW